MLKYIKINDQNHGRHDENVVRHEAATTPEQIQCTCVAQSCRFCGSSIAQEYAPWTACCGRVPACIVSVTEFALQ